MAVVSPFPRNNSCSSFIGRDRKARLGTTGSPAIKKSEFVDCQPSPKKPLHRSKSDSSKEPLPCYKSYSSKESLKIHDAPATKEPLPCYKSDSSKEPLPCYKLDSSKGTFRSEERLLELLYLINRPARETLKPYLGAGIGLSREECKDSNKFDERLREALEKHKEMLRRFDLQKYERKKLDGSKTIQYSCLDLLLIQKLILIFSIAECKEDWLWYQVKRDGCPIEKRDDVVRSAIESSMSEILRSNVLSDKERMKIFAIVPFDKLEKEDVRQLVSFLSNVYQKAVPPGGTELGWLLQAIKDYEDDYDRNKPNDIDHQLSLVLPKYTFLSCRDSSRSWCITEALRNKLVRCKNVDRHSCQCISPYFATKLLSECRMSLPKSCDSDALKSFRSLLDYLPSTSPESSLVPRNWLNVTLLIDALCQYYRYLCHYGASDLDEAASKKHRENIIMLFHKLGLMVPPNLEKMELDKAREKAILNICAVGEILQAKDLSFLDEDSEDLDDVRAFLTVCDSSYKMGQYQCAIDMLEVGRDLYQEQRFDFFYRIAMSYWKLGRPEIAEKNFICALESLPESLRVQSSYIFTDYASLLAAQGRFDEADSLLAKNSITSDWKYYFELGKHHFAVERYDDALKCYNAAADLVTSESMAQAIVTSGMANVHLERGDVYEAIGLYQNVLQIVKDEVATASETADLKHNLTDALESLNEDPYLTSLTGRQELL